MPALDSVLRSAALIDAAGWTLIAMVCGASLIGAALAIMFCGWAEGLFASPRRDAARRRSRAETRSAEMLREVRS